MKYSELEIGDKFKAPSSEKPDIIFEKVSPRSASCCTPEYNALYIKPNKKKGFMMFPNEEDVVQYINPEEENVTVGSEPSIQPKDEPEDDVMFQGRWLSEELKTQDLGTYKKLRLSQVSVGTVFRINGIKYSHSIDGRSGGKRVAIVNLETGEETVKLATEYVDVYSNDTGDFENLTDIKSH